MAPDPRNAFAERSAGVFALLPGSGVGRAGRVFARPSELPWSRVAEVLGDLPVLAADPRMASGEGESALPADVAPDQGDPMVDDPLAPVPGVPAADGPVTDPPAEGALSSNALAQNALLDAVRAGLAAEARALAVKVGRLEDLARLAEQDA